MLIEDEFNVNQQQCCGGEILLDFIGTLLVGAKQDVICNFSKKRKYRYGFGTINSRIYFNVQIYNK